MSDEREAILAEGIKQKTKEILEQLPYTKEVFLNQHYELRNTIENHLDFFLGIVLAQILERFSVYCLTKDIALTSDEGDKIKYMLFSRASEFKGLVGKILED